VFAKLDGYVFGSESGAAWSISAGVSPYQASFICDKIEALALLDGATVDGSKLTIDDGNGSSQEFDKLTILRLVPTNNPNEVRVMVSDRRWHWGRKWIKRGYNIRRKSGKTKKLAEASDNVAEFQQDITYQPWSLNKGKPWKAEDVLIDILKELVGSDFEPDMTGLQGMPVIESLEIDSPGDVALGRVLSVMGNMASVFIKPNGIVKLYDAFSGKEGELVGFTNKTQVRGKREGSVPLVVGYPTWLVQDRRIERPSKVRVLFTRALELRFDNSEYSQGLSASGTQVKGSGDNLVVDPEVMNVLPVPENVSYFGSIYPLGSYLPLDTYLEFLQTQSTPSGLPNLTRDLLNRLWLQGALDAYGALDPSGLWGRRVGSLRAHYRRTYRVVRPYSDRIRLFSERRVTLQDAETDGYLAAPAFFDYAEFMSWRRIGANKASDGPKPARMVKNRYSNKASARSDTPGTIIGKPINQLSPAPANIRMIDPVLGIFSIDFYQDISARAISYVHSALTQIPTEDPAKDETWLQDGHLVNYRELSVVMTTFPAAPNDNRQLYAIEIDVSKAGDLGDRPYTTDKVGSGPVVEVRVMPNVAMARYEWPSDRTEGNEIKKWFAEAIVPSDQAALDPKKDKDVFGTPINPEELQAVAFVKAREVFARYVDHLEGGATSGIRPGIEIKGIAKEIVHAAAPTGALTSVTFPPDPPKIDLSQLMPASVRKLVDRSPEL
jgi:hypothetical protein